MRTVPITPGAPPWVPSGGRPPRAVVVYPAIGTGRIEVEEAFGRRMRALGHDVRPFAVPCDGWLPFVQLDELWRRRDPGLMSVYDRLSVALEEADIVVASGGSMLHPALLEQFHGTSVFTCADDPESSELLSKPTAPHFDLSLVVNPACLDDYRSWGCRNVRWIFPMLHADRFDLGVTEASILDGSGRDLDLVLCCEREFGLSDRHNRVETLLETFPQATVRGPGWPAGPQPQIELYPRARIGWNLHNSTGPCNTRALELPANGVFQLCDNPGYLSCLFELDREIVAYDTVAECVEKTHHYLEHEDERRAIAVAGFRRVHREYTERHFWEYLLAAVSDVAVSSR